MHITKEQAQLILSWFEAYESELLPTTSNEYIFAGVLADIAGDTKAVDNYVRCAIDEMDREIKAAADEWEPEDERDWMERDAQYLSAVKHDPNSPLAKMLRKCLGK